MALSGTPVQLAPAAYEPSDPIATLLNCYCLCEPNWNHLYNLIHPGPEFADASTKFRDLLSCKAPARKIQDLLTQPNVDAALIHLLALMQAVAFDIGSDPSRASNLTRYSKPYRSLAQFGQQEFWLSLNSAHNDSQHLLRNLVPRRPRDLSRLHDTFSLHHIPLNITPAVHQGMKLAAIPTSQRLENEIERRMQAREFRIAISSLTHDAELHGSSRTHNGRAFFRLTAIEQAEPQKLALHQLLNQAYVAGATFLVLPELRMTPDLAATTADFLRAQQCTEKLGLLLVVAGSWHIETNGHLYNRSAVLDDFGEPLWSHDKLREYVIEPQNVTSNPALYGRIGVDAQGAAEDINRGDSLQFYDSVVGRIAALICVGFFSQELEPLLRASGADIFLIPAMTPSMKPLADRAKSLTFSQNAFTFAANCGTVGALAPSFWYRPSTSSPTAEMPAGGSLLLLDLNDISK